MNRVYLRSDFSDYYDHHFEARLGMPGEVCFRRFTTDGEDKPGQWRELERMGFLVPAWGTLSEMSRFHWGGCRVVIHPDPKAHRGEGKNATSIETAIATGVPLNTPTMRMTGEEGRSVRWLKVGSRAWAIEYRNRDGDWRSNVGDVEVKVLHELAQVWDDPHPLAAIDFVEDEERLLLYAVDYNIAPGLRGTGMENILEPAEVASLIKAAVLDANASPTAKG